mmetsp:Transcript_6667/g.9321  ORF Transcript_6667/g.9321 Transcript_6667/m.9321 type:complete len:607 (-) Transcript_6667:261-2081(-)
MAQYFGEVVAHLEGKLSLSLYEGENYIGRYPWYGGDDDEEEKDRLNGPYLVLSDPEICPRHAIIEIRIAEGDALVRCRNGQTIVDGVECRPRISRRLQIGSTVKFGPNLEYFLRWGNKSPQELEARRVVPFIDQFATLTDDEDEPLRFQNEETLNDDSTPIRQSEIAQEERIDKIPRDEEMNPPHYGPDEPTIPYQADEEINSSFQKQEENETQKKDDQEMIFKGEGWRTGTSIAIVSAAQARAGADALPPSPPKSISKCSSKKRMIVDDDIFNEETQVPSQFDEDESIKTPAVISSKKSKRSSVPHDAATLSKTDTSSKKQKPSLKRRQIETTRSSKRTRRRVVPHILVTGIVDQKDREDIGRLISGFGAIATNKACDATHLITSDQLKRTPNFLAAIAANVEYVLNFGWLRASARAGRALDEAPYMIRDIQAEKNWGFDLAASLRTKTKVLQGYMVALAPGLRHETKLPKDSELDEIVQAAGGIFVHDIHYEETNQAPKGLLVLSTMERIHAGIKQESSSLPKKTLRRVPFEQSRQSTTPPAKYSHVDAADALRAIRSLPRERLAGVLEPVTFWRIILRKKLDLNSDVLPPHAVSPITKHQHQQ